MCVFVYVGIPVLGLGGQIVRNYRQNTNSDFIVIVIDSV